MTRTVWEGSVAPVLQGVSLGICCWLPSQGLGPDSDGLWQSYLSHIKTKQLIITTTDIMNYGEIAEREIAQSIKVMAQSFLPQLKEAPRA